MKYTYLEFKRNTRQWIFPWTPFVSPISDRVLFDRMHVVLYTYESHNDQYAFYRTTPDHLWGIRMVSMEIFIAGYYV